MQLLSMLIDVFLIKIIKNKQWVWIIRVDIHIDECIQMLNPYFSVVFDLTYFFVGSSSKATLQLF